MFLQLHSINKFLFFIYRAVTHDLSDIEKEEPHDMAPPRFIEIQKGKISLAPAKTFESPKDKVKKNVLFYNIFFKMKHKAANLIIHNKNLN